jgi:polyhydroxyalkanoate synthesis regulator phasin
MLEVIKKSVLASIGMLALTEEKIQELTDELIQKGKLSQKEGESLVNEFQKALDENKTKLAAMIHEQVKSLLKELNLVTKDNLKELEKSLKQDFAKLEKQLAKLEKQVKSA